MDFLDDSLVEGRLLAKADCGGAVEPQDANFVTYHSPSGDNSYCTSEHGSLNEPDTSIDRLQDLRCLRMLHHVFPQQVVMPGVHPADLLARAEGQMAIGIQTGDNPESIRGHGAGVVVLA